MDQFINIANLFYIAGYLVRDMLLLRVLSLVGASCLIVYFLSRPEPLMMPVYWNLFYMALNVFWVTRLGWERLQSRRRLLTADG